ncbi:hypothetical protein Q9S36_22690 [Microbacterium sp. ARD31]|uniref:hypothetical protein n=1 Tax=Microbacterium sp. ARD31 TaxID=2962576 RepID=UPI0028819C3D|nr:hypothetical protein [Microbacterium sp. ARD31]MDT0182992.1 hypothetical protein [Microbacterium sp. ARD31]
MTDAVHPVLLTHEGPHGVAIYARDLADAVRGISPSEVGSCDLSRLDELAPGTPVHAQFTDRLWGSSPEEAARAFAGVARRHPLSVTLHDVPQASDGARNLPRRRAAYAAVARAATKVAVNSEHERALLVEEQVWDDGATVIALPVPTVFGGGDGEGGPGGGERPVPDGSVGVLGYFYPGKGHDEALAAAVEAGAGRLTVLGRASDGHAGELDAFVRRAASTGVHVEVTGWLDDDAMAARCRAVSVPVIAHRHVSASGSLVSWIGWGRRPVCVENRYVDEMARLRPGTLTPVREDRLADAVRTALDVPDSTWHDIERMPMARADVAAAYLRWWAGDVV